MMDLAPDAVRDKEAEARIKEYIADLQGRNDVKKYGGNCHLEAILFGMMTVNITDGTVKNTYSRYGAIVGVSFGVYGGELYTDDVNRLYADTAGWGAVNLLNAYFGVVFYDGNLRPLGTFQAGGVAVGTPVAGGGLGRWDRR